VAVRNGTLYLTLPTVDQTQTLAAAEWLAMEHVRVIEASVDLSCATLGPIRLDSVVADGDVPSLDPSAHGIEGRNPGNGQLSLLEILRVANERKLIRRALIACATGGTAGLFEAYEAISYEILNSGVQDFAAGIGSREWLIAQGWITDEDDRRFLENHGPLQRGSLPCASRRASLSG
jgi:hypothetical protein